MAKLTPGGRSKIKTSNFAIPGKAKTASAKKKSGNYPIPDKKHAKSALGLVGMHGTPEQKAQVRAAVHRKFPDMGAKKGSTVKKSVRPKPKPRGR